MGLIRKSLSVSTLGAVSGKSKKQRVAKASLNQLQMLNAANGNTAKGYRGARGQGAAKRMANQVNRQATSHAAIAASMPAPAIAAPTQAKAPLPAGTTISPDGQHVLVENEWKQFAHNATGAFWFNTEVGAWVSL